MYAFARASNSVPIAMPPTAWRGKKYITIFSFDTYEIIVDFIPHQPPDLLWHERAA